jgi:CDP-glycerol glycerophosphotransferase (TagB/SpsB family)
MLVKKGERAQNLWQEQKCEKTFKPYFELKIIEMQDSCLLIEGYADASLIDGETSLVVVDETGKFYKLNTEAFRPADRFDAEGNLVISGIRFSVKIPVSTYQKLSFFLRRSDTDLYNIAPRLGDLTGLTSRLHFSYCLRDRYIVRFRKGHLLVKKIKGAVHWFAELLLLLELCWKLRFSAAAYRILYRLTNCFNRQPIWLISDRPHRANDNGEALFRYLVAQGYDRDRQLYFVLNSDSPDFHRLSQIGMVIDRSSLRYKMKFLHAELIISSTANTLATNAFGKKGCYYHDLYHFDFIYLRHGVSHNDQSRWLNRLNKNISLLMATAPREREALLSGDYLYDVSQIKLTGQPRYDTLFDQHERLLSIMPTWRTWLAGSLIPRSVKRSYNAEFANSEYCRFYNRLINDERLIDELKAQGYRARFYVHPVLDAQMKDFCGNEYVTIFGAPEDYQDVLKKSALLVTDYSSIAFDFAWLRKPLVYAQFDRADFYDRHSWNVGYFDYSQDGFGSVAFTYEDTIAAIIEGMRNNCQMPTQYVQRVENFFAFNDRNNCQRVCDALGLARLLENDS